MRLSTAAAYVAAAAEGKAQDKPLHSSAPRFDDGRAPEHENQQQNPSHGQTFRMSRLRVEFMRRSARVCESREGRLQLLKPVLEANFIRERTI